MYKTKIELNNIIFEGVLDFYVIRKVQEILKKHGFEHKVYHIFKNISSIETLDEDIGHYTVNALLLQSLNRCGFDEEYIEQNYCLEEDPIDTFTKVFEYISELIEKCMPKSEDIEDEYEKPSWWSPKDWDFDDMEYMWYSMLKRTDDFYKITPKNFFKQMDIYKEVNTPKK